MAKRACDQLEEDIIKAFMPDADGTLKRFTYQGREVEAYIGGKPTQHRTANDPYPGNPKTDVYIGVRDVKNHAHTDAIKISVKKDDAKGKATFVENWVTAERAAVLFPGGENNYKKVIARCFNSLHYDALEENDATHYDGKHGNGMKVGWNFFITMHPTGSLSGSFRNIIVDKDEQKALLDEVYAGTNLSEGKRNCTVGADSNGLGFGDINLIENSGVANCMLHTDLNNVSTPQIIIDQLTDIPSRITEEQDLYFMFKGANAYDDQITNASSMVAIPIIWKVNEGADYITPTLLCDESYVLEKTNRELWEHLKNEIKTKQPGGVETINDIVENNLCRC